MCRVSKDLIFKLYSALHLTSQFFKVMYTNNYEGCKMLIIKIGAYVQLGYHVLRGEL